MITIYSGYGIIVRSLNDNVELNYVNLTVSKIEKTILQIEKTSEYYDFITNIKINGIIYYFYNESTIDVDITDIIRSNATEIRFVWQHSNNDIAEIYRNFIKINGVYAPLTDIYMPPSVIVMRNGFRLYVPIIGKTNNTFSITSYTSAGSVIATTTLSTPNRGCQFYRNYLISSSTRDAYFIYNGDTTKKCYLIREKDCGKRYVNIVWRSLLCASPTTELMKSWVFEVVSETGEATESVNLYSSGNYFNFLKNKQTGIKVVARNVNYETMKYLSDIILSDNYTLTLSDNTNVSYAARCETNKIEVMQVGQTQNLELEFTIKKYIVI